MKKRWLMAALLALGFAFLLTGCVETDIIGKTYKVAFISEGAEYDSADAAFGSNVVFPETSPTKEDDETYTYTFEGWSLTEGEDADLVTSHVVIGDVTFYAVFSRAEIDGEDVYFSVSFKDGVTGEKLGEDQKVKEGEDATLPTPPEHDGYTFDKWDRAHTNITAKTVITALYTKNQYQLTRNFLGETKDESVEYDSALVLTAPEDVESVFVFEGWYWDKNYDTPVETGEKMPANKAEIFAKYSVDFSDAAITTDSDLVYGKGDDAAAVSGLKNTENNNIVYSFVWNDDSTAQKVELRNAGVYELSVTVTAVYGGNVLTDTVKLSETVTVEKAVLDVTVALGADSVVYGTASAPSVTYSGFQYEDSQTSLNLRPNYTYTDKDGALAAGNKLGVGTYTVGAEFAELGNYTIGAVSAATLTVTPKDLTVTVSAKSFAYGETHEVSLQFDGFANGDAEDSLGGEVIYKYTKNGASYTPDGRFGAGAYTIAAEGFESENYTISYAGAAAFTVSKRAATATLRATGGVYGTKPAYSVSFEGILSEDEGSFVPEYLFTKDGAAYQADGLFGAGTYTVTASFAANENYDLKIISAEFTVAQAELNIGVKTTALVYGNAPKFEITYDGFIEGEDESVLSGKAVFAYTKDGKEYPDARFVAGSYAVSVSGLTSENYLITFAAAANFEVAKKDLTLTVTLQNTELVYGERPVPTITPEGFVYEENMGNIGNPTVLYKDADGVDVKDSFHVGNYVATVKAQSDNYNIIVEEISFTVAKKDLTATVSLKESSLTYGVAPKPSVVYEGFISYAEEEKLTANVVFTYSKGDGSKLAVGNYEVSLDGLELSDYNVKIVTAQLSVTKKTLTIDVTADKEGYIYGETPKLALSFGEFAYGEDEKVLAGGSLSVFRNAVLFEDERFIVGEYTAKAVGFTSGNYDIEMGEVSFAVAPKEVTVTLSAQSEYTFGDAVDVTYSVSGLAFDETESVLGNMTIVYTKDGAAYTPAALFKAGEYSATIENLANDNYTIKVVAATFTVNKQVFSVSQSVTLKSGTEWTYAPQFAEGSPFVFEGTVRLKTTNEGTYTATDENGFAQNFEWVNGYGISYQGTDVTSDFEITYNLSVTLNDSDFSSITLPSETTVTYNGSPFEFGITVQESFAKVEYSIDGGEFTTDVPSLTNAKVYTIVYRVSADNYKTEENSFEVTILKAQNEIDLTNVGAMEFTYDGTDHAVDFTKATAKNGVVSVSGETVFKDAGEYVVTLSVAESENYLAVEKKVTVKVAKADYEIVAENQSYVYTGKPQGGKISVAAIGGDTYTVSYNNAATVPVLTNVGSLTVEYTVSGNDNYNDTKGSYVLSITKAPNSIDIFSVKDTEWTYDAKEHVIDLSGVTAAFGGENWGDHAFINAGTYTITLTVAGTENYDGATATIEVVVHKAALTVTVQGNNFTFNADKQGNGVKVEALGTDDGYSTEYTYNNDKSNIVPQFIDAGSYTVSYRVYGDNYVENTGSYTIVIAQKQLTVTNPGDQSKTYDGEEFGTGVTVAGNVDDQYTVTYYVNGELFSGIPAFVDAGEYKVTYTVSGKNYVTVNDSYTITIAKAQGAIDASKVLKEYTYNGSEQAVDLDAVVWTGDGARSNTSNTFTNVPNGGSFVITLTLSEGKNYFGETEEITITVHKAVYENVVPHPAISEGMGVDKKLSEVKLDANYRWADPTILLVSGEKQYDAYYNADPVNYEDFALQITVNGRREKVTIAVDPLEADFDATELPDYTLNYVLYDEDGERITEKALPSLNPVLKVTATNAEYKIGSTYYVLFVVESYDAENQYYELTNLETETAFKLKSVGVGDKLYTVEDALAHATSGNVIVKHDTAFASAETLAVLTDLYSAANYEVKAGVTLLVPYDASYSTNTKDVERTWVAVGKTAFVTLTVSENTALTVYGKLIVNAKMVTASNPTTSTPKGNHFGQMEVKDHAVINFETGASFECMGFAFGKGSIIVKTGANMVEPFNLVGYKGGSISLSLRSKVFPINQYSISSIICNTEIQFGANYIARAFVTGKPLFSEKDVNADVSFVSTTNKAFIQLSSGSVFKSLNEGNGEITFDIHGDAALNNLTLSLDGLLSMDTSKLQVPVPGNFNIIISSGTSTISQGVQIKMLPGMDLTVEKGAKLVVAGKSEKSAGGLSAYGNDNYTFADNKVIQWQDGELGNVKDYPCLNMPNVYRTKPVFEYNATTPAKVIVKGELIVCENAYFAVTLSAEKDAKISIEPTSVLTYSIQEDYSKTGAIDYFTTNFILNGNFNGEYAASFEVGKTYTYTANGWEIVA